MKSYIYSIIFFLLMQGLCNASVEKYSSVQIAAKREILHIFSEKSLAGVEYWFSGKISPESSKELYSKIKKNLSQLSDDDRIRFAILFNFSFSWGGEYAQDYRDTFLTERTSNKYDKALIKKLLLIPDEKYKKYCLNRGIDLAAIHGFRCMLDCL